MPRPPRCRCARRLRTRLPARHPLDLLKAFRLDVTKLRYRDWDDLMDYCRYSANPVGRFVLDVHGDRSTWPAMMRSARPSGHQSPAGLRQGLPRPQPRLYSARHICRRGLTPEVLGAGKRPAGAAGRIQRLNAAHTMICCNASRLLAPDRRSAPGAEVAVIQRLALTLTGMLATRDPLERQRASRQGGLPALARSAWPRAWRCACSPVGATRRRASA